MERVGVTNLFLSQSLGVWTRLSVSHNCLPYRPCHHCYQSWDKGHKYSIFYIKFPHYIYIYIDKKIPEEIYVISNSLRRWKNKSFLTYKTINYTMNQLVTKSCNKTRDIISDMIMLENILCNQCIIFLFGSSCRYAFCCVYGSPSFSLSRVQQKITLSTGLHLQRSTCSPLFAKWELNLFLFSPHNLQWLNIVVHCQIHVVFSPLSCTALMEIDS